MARKSTSQKEKVVIKEFHRLLRSGKDYETTFMYSEAGKKAFVISGTAGNMIRRYYQKLITDEMRIFVEQQNGSSFNCIMEAFSDKFGVCKRESRYILGYLR